MEERLLKNRGIISLGEKVFHKNIEYKYRVILSKEKEIGEVSGDIFILRKLWMKLNFNKGKSELFHY